LYADDFIIVLPLGVAKQVSGVAFKVRAIGTEAAE
jgi:hypothetical protein